MRLQQAGGMIGGTFAGLAEDGSLLLQANGRVHAFSTGHVLLDGEAPPAMPV
jgi:biotin-(acetyl-CoA carboxylase) ligase